MKRINNLFDKIVDYDNLHLAYIKARKGKRRRTEVKRFEQNKELLLRRLQQHLIEGTYKTSKYKTNKTEYRAHISPYLGWLKYCDSYRLSNKIIVYKELLVYIYTDVRMVT